MTKKKVLWIVAACCVLLCAGMLLARNGAMKAHQERTDSVESTSFTVDPDIMDKEPGEYSWEEYQAMSLEQQDTFFEWFESEEDFEAWLKSVKPEQTTVPENEWNQAKQPSAYTWEEYTALNQQEQDAFFLWFGSVEAFEAWLETVKPEQTTVPEAVWDQMKQPIEYTWEEYSELSHQEQDAFFRWFDSVEAFEAWMESVKPAETTEPVIDWNEAGKEPSAYTWEEYMALSPQEQDEFFQWFDSEQAFEDWMESVKPTQTTEPEDEWNQIRKPSEYTWEEYEALSPQEQDAFFRWFPSVEAFEDWMESVKPVEATEPAIDWDHAEKKPNEYTWEEYEALSPQEQDAFFQWFDSVEDFEAWMEAAKAQHQ